MFTLESGRVAQVNLNAEAAGESDQSVKVSILYQATKAN